ncbi:MAG: hypothetical protein ACI4TY_02555 [Candidatus Limosilactobacillus intestinavium]
MNFVKKYHINDVLDSLIDRYGPDWDIDAEIDDPDLAVIKTFRNAIKMRDKQRKEKAKLYLDRGAVVMFDTVTSKMRVFATTKDVATLLNVTPSRIYQAIHEQRVVRHRFKFKRQLQYLEDGGF